MKMLLDVLNGASIAPDLLWLTLIGIYLCKESRRRQLHPLDWFHLPPSMNLMLAMFICDSGVCLRTITRWVWERFYRGGEFDFVIGISLGIGGALMVCGALCKIRALTKPDHGDGPWLLASITTTVALLLLCW